MERKTLRTLVVSGALIAGIGMVGVSAASAVIEDPGGATSGYDGRTGSTYPLYPNVSKAATVDGLRVRTGPGTHSTIVGLVYKGEPVQIITSARDWRGQAWDKVMLQNGSAGGLPGGYVGWVSEEYLY
ncbi:SH3 domain-containing protein [Streptomyces bauhiniae]|uniref:SH3 domain-containing protein n=1 Tax=Streptomyces bauhiniae TaxID=2340725 RepID=UPI00364DAB02